MPVTERAVEYVTAHVRLPRELYLINSASRACRT
jgi:hypothetical protein